MNGQFWNNSSRKEEYNVNYQLFCLILYFKCFYFFLQFIFWFGIYFPGRYACEAMRSFMSSYDFSEPWPEIFVQFCWHSKNYCSKCPRNRQNKRSWLNTKTNHSGHCPGRKFSFSSKWLFMINRQNKQTHEKTKTKQYDISGTSRHFIWNGENDDVDKKINISRFIFNQVSFNNYFV